MYSYVTKTICLEKKKFDFSHNVSKCRSIFKLLSSAASWRNCLQCMCQLQRFPPHLNCNTALPCEIWKFQITAFQITDERVLLLLSDLVIACQLGQVHYGQGCVSVSMHLALKVTSRHGILMASWCLALVPTKLKFAMHWIRGSASRSWPQFRA